MTVATAELDRPMAKKKLVNSRPSTSVKLHDDVLEMGRIIASLKKVTITDLISDTLRPLFEEMQQEEATKLIRKPTKKTKES